MPRREGRAVSSVTRGKDGGRGRDEAIAASLEAAGRWGAILMAAIVATSALLRLATAIDPSGEAVSTLPQAAEAAMRLAHRVAAMGVGVLAAFVAMAAFAKRPVPWARLLATAVIVALTVLLAAIGRHTTGYRSAAVSVANVAGGTALACAFWWLRERERFAAQARRGPLAWIALAALLLQGGAGTAASTLALRGDVGLGSLHLALAGLFVALAVAAVWRYRTRRGPAIAVGILAILAIACGAWSLAAGDGPPLALAWAHAMLGAALGPALVSLAIRPADRGSSGSAPRGRESPRRPATT